MGTAGILRKCFQGASLQWHSRRLRRVRKLQRNDLLPGVPRGKTPWTQRETVGLRLLSRAAAPKRIGPPSELDRGKDGDHSRRVSCDLEEARDTAGEVRT